MRVHPNQINPNTQLNALYAAERAAATREAGRTRKKLLEFGSELAGESDSGEDCVVTLREHEESQEQARRHNQQNQGNRKKQEGQVDSKDAENSLSDWA